MGNVIQWSYRVSTNYFQHPVYPYRMIVFVSVQFCSDRLNLYDGRRVGGVQAIIIHAMTVHCPLVSPRAPAELPNMILTRAPAPNQLTRPLHPAQLTKRFIGASQYIFFILSHKHLRWLNEIFPRLWGLNRPPLL